MKQVLFVISIVMLFFSSGLTGLAQDSGTVADADVVKIQGDFSFIEGPVWHKDGYLLFSDIPANKIYQWKPGESAKVWRADSGKSNGLTLDPQGRLIVCEHWNRRVSRTEADGSVITIADQYHGKKLNSPNDVIVRSDGMIFFTDPQYGVEGRVKEQAVNGVYRVLPGEKPVLLVSDFTQPNGLALSPDEKTLYIADSEKSVVRKFAVKKDGSAEGGEIFIHIKNPDGIRCSKKGNLYVTSSESKEPYKGSINVFDPAGKRIQQILCPEQPANCGFAGEKNQWLFITARNGLYKVELKNP